MNYLANIRENTACISQYMFARESENVIKCRVDAEELLKVNVKSRTP